MFGAFESTFLIIFSGFLCVCHFVILSFCHFGRFLLCKIVFGAFKSTFLIACSIIFIGCWSVLFENACILLFGAIATTRTHQNTTKINNHAPGTHIKPRPQKYFCGLVQKSDHQTSDHQTSDHAPGRTTKILLCNCVKKQPPPQKYFCVIIPKKRPRPRNTQILLYD